MNVKLAVCSRLKDTGQNWHSSGSSQVNGVWIYRALSRQQGLKSELICAQCRAANTANGHLHSTATLLAISTPNATTSTTTSCPTFTIFSITCTTNIWLHYFALFTMHVDVLCTMIEQCYTTRYSVSLDTKLCSTFLNASFSDQEMMVQQRSAYCTMRGVGDEVSWEQDGVPCFLHLPSAFNT